MPVSDSKLIRPGRSRLQPWIVTDIVCHTISCLCPSDLFLADIGQKYMVNKYPTLKLFRNGEMIKKEYRYFLGGCLLKFFPTSFSGQRSADALTDFVNKQTISKIVEVGSEEELIQKVDVRHF